MKYVWAFAIAIILIGLPFGSFIYLRKGLQYRFDRLEELQPKELLTNEYYIGNDSITNVVNDKLKNKITVVHFANENTTPEQMQRMSKLFEQYRIREDFRVLHVMNESTPSEIIALANDSSFIIANYKFNSSKDTIFPLYLIGNSGKIRSSYEFKEDRFKKLVEHVPSLIPLEEHKKIKLKRDLQN